MARGDFSRHPDGLELTILSDSRGNSPVLPMLPFGLEAENPFIAGMVRQRLAIGVLRVVRRSIWDARDIGVQLAELWDAKLMQGGHAIAVTSDMPFPQRGNLRGTTLTPGDATPLYVFSTTAPTADGRPAAHNDLHGITYSAEGIHGYAYGWNTMNTEGGTPDAQAALRVLSHYLIEKADS